MKEAGATPSLPPHALLRRDKLSKITGKFYSLILIYESLQEFPKDMTPAQRCNKVRFVSFCAVKTYSGSMVIDPPILSLELSLTSHSGLFSPGKKNLVAVE
jgi:hypothetical protein